MGFGTLAAGRGPEILRCLAQDLDGLARVDAGEHHDVGGDHLDGGGRGDRRLVLPRAAGGPAGEVECAVSRPLPGRAVAGRPGQVGDRAGQFAHAGGEPPTLGRAHGQCGPGEQQAAAAEQVKMARVLALAHHPCHSGPPDH
jgi:hypothetical protein